MKREAFETLYAEHAQPLFGFLAYRTGDRVLAEDLLADTFVRALQARRRFDPRRASEKTWLYSIALNLLRDHVRRTDAERRALERTPVPAAAEEPAVEQIGDRDALSRAMSALSDEEREALALRYGADLTMPEMAQLLGEKLTTVDGRVHRALRKLREELS